MLNRDRRIRWERRGGPLQRYLESNVGRPWDKVYSELCRQLKRNSYNEREIREQIDRLVHRDVREVNRQVVEASQRGYVQIGRPLRGGALYVCPRTGLLRRTRKQRPETTPKPAVELPVVKVNDEYQCHWRDGVWYLLTMLPVAQVRGRIQASTRQDVWLNLTVSDAVAAELRKAYGGLKYAVSARALSKHELRNWPIPVEWQ